MIFYAPTSIPTLLRMFASMIWFKLTLRGDPMAAPRGRCPRCGAPYP